MSAADTDPRGVIDAALAAVEPTASQVVRIGRDARVDSRNFEYADLIKGGPLARRIGAVIEKDGSPLVYVAVVDARETQIGRELAQLLGNRGETASLLGVERTEQGLIARAWPCTLEVPAPTALDLSNPIDARSVLGDLQEGLWSTQNNAHQERRLRDLLISSVDRVARAFLSTVDAKDAAQRGDEVLALVGRALFTRFLIDRQILTATTAPRLWQLIGDDGAAAFVTASHAAATCRWLDTTFNGEFMPLAAQNNYESYFAGLQQQSPDALLPLTWIVGRTDANGQLPLWDRLDFSHIPVGTLSEVYENYAHKRAGEAAKATSVYFTPRHVARMMVRQAMRGLDPARVADAKLLDPAVGAGVFLSLAYRELARHRALRDDNQWPDTGALRDILYHQLRGMDFNADALNLAALTLYLTAIELDANPLPPEKLRFGKRLIGTVLLDVGEGNANDPVQARLGSLRSDTAAGADEFDIVIGNPPWSSLGVRAMPANVGVGLEREAEAVAMRCLQRRGVDAKPRYRHPDRVPDIAFVWKATEWAKENGVIALIVHERLMTKRSEVWRNARQALFSAIEVEGLLDAAEFANHEDLLWPGIEAPCCVVFARNRKPPPAHRSTLLALTVEPSLSHRQQVRLDPTTTLRVGIEDFDEAPGGLVTRLLGCELDRALLRRWEERLERNAPASAGVRRLGLRPLASCIREFSEVGPRRGFKTGNVRTSTPAWFAQLPKDTREIPGKTTERIAGAIPADSVVANFHPRPVRSSPSLAWYQPPILLIRQGMGNFGDLERAAIVLPSPHDTPVIYPFAFEGTPFKDNADALLYAQYVSLWVNSVIFSYYQTLTSTQFTFNIKALLGEEIRRAPVLPLGTALSAKLTTPNEIEGLFARLSAPSHQTQAAIDDWAHRLIGSDEGEKQLVADTLSVRYPIGPSRKSGRSWVPDRIVQAFVDQLSRDLTHAPSAIAVDSLRVVQADELKGWRFVAWGLSTGTTGAPAFATAIRDLTPTSLVKLVREKYPEGEIWAHTDAGECVFGRIALHRLWLPSRASLIAPAMVAWADQCTK